MGRIVRDGVQAYEVVDEGRGLVREADFGTSVMSELESGLPFAFNIMNWFYKIFLRGFITVRNKIVPVEELEAILVKEEEKKNRKFDNGLWGAFAGLMHTSFWITEVSFQIIVSLVKKGIAKCKQVIENSINR